MHPVSIILATAWVAYGMVRYRHAMGWVHLWSAYVVVSFMAVGIDNVFGFRGMGTPALFIALVMLAAEVCGLAKDKRE